MAPQGAPHAGPQGPELSSLVLEHLRSTFAPLNLSHVRKILPCFVDKYVRSPVCNIRWRGYKTASRVLAHRVSSSPLLSFPSLLPFPPYPPPLCDYHFTQTGWLATDPSCTMRCTCHRTCDVCASRRLQVRLAVFPQEIARSSFHPAYVYGYDTTHRSPNSSH